MFDEWVARLSPGDFIPGVMFRPVEESYAYLRDPAWRAANPQLPWFVFEKPTPEHAVEVQDLSYLTYDYEHVMRPGFDTLTFPGVTDERQRAELAFDVLYIFCTAFTKYMQTLWRSEHELDVRLRRDGPRRGQIVHLEWRPFSREQAFSNALNRIEQVINLPTEDRAAWYAGTLFEHEPPECLLRIPSERDFHDAIALRHRLADSVHLGADAYVRCQDEIRWIRRWLEMYQELQIDERRLAVHMAWHRRLGRESALGALPQDVLYEL